MHRTLLLLNRNWSSSGRCLNKKTPLRQCNSFLVNRRRGGEWNRKGLELSMSSASRMDGGAFTNEVDVQCEVNAKSRTGSILSLCDGGRTDNFTCNSKSSSCPSVRDKSWNGGRSAPLQHCTGVSIMRWLLLFRRKAECSSGLNIISRLCILSTTGTESSPVLFQSTVQKMRLVRRLNPNNIYQLFPRIDCNLTIPWRLWLITS